MSFLFFKFRGEVIVQPPAAACGRPITTQASNCGLTSGGGICAGGHVHLGSLNDSDVHIKAGLKDLDFGATGNFHVNILGVGVGFGIEASKALLAVKASALGAKFGFSSIAHPDERSDQDVLNILNQISPSQAVACSGKSSFRRT